MKIFKKLFILGAVFMWSVGPVLFLQAAQRPCLRSSQSQSSKESHKGHSRNVSFSDRIQLVDMTKEAANQEKKEPAAPVTKQCEKAPLVIKVQEKKSSSKKDASAKYAEESKEPSVLINGEAYYQKICEAVNDDNLEVVYVYLLMIVDHQIAVPNLHKVVDLAYANKQVNVLKIFEKFRLGRHCSMCHRWLSECPGHGCCVIM